MLPGSLGPSNRPRLQESPTSTLQFLQKGPGPSFLHSRPVGLFLFNLVPLSAGKRQIPRKIQIFDSQKFKKFLLPLDDILIPEQVHDIYLFFMFIP
jgi:hypothetical protein